MKKILIALALVVLAQPAMAHARLVGSAPEGGSHARDIDKVELTFSEKLEPAFSGAQLADEAGKPVTAAMAISGDTIVFTMPRLKAGRYRVHWHSVGEDTHRMEGSFQFIVLP